MQVKTKSLIVSVLAVVIVGLVWFQFVYSPMKSKASKSNAAAKTSQSEVDNLQQELDQLTASDKKAKANDIGATQMLTAVPADAAEASFFRSLDAVRAGSGATWQSVTPSTPAAAGNVASIGLNIQVAGNETTLARYLAGLYAMQRVFIADNVTLSQSGCPDPLGRCPNGALFKGGDMTMTVTGRIFAGLAAVPASTSTLGRSTTPASSASSTASSASSSASSSSTSG